MIAAGWLVAGTLVTSYETMLHFGPASGAPFWLAMTVFLAAESVAVAPYAVLCGLLVRRER